MTKYSDLMTFLNALGLAEQLDSFAGRKRIQKFVYMLKQFGADLRFGYTWYVHGPYSPELTRTLFNPTNEDLDSKRELTRSELAKLNRMRNFLADDFYSVDRLELLVSLVYLIKHGPKEGYDTRQRIIQYLRSQKPQFSDDDIEAAWRKIEKSRTLGSYLSKLESDSA